MTAIVSDKLRIYNAQRFAIDSAADNIYAFLGRSVAWSNENLPDLPEDTVEQRDFAYWKDALGFQKIAGAMTCIPRYNWTAGTIYARYDSNDSELLRKAFFVLSTDVTTGRLYVYKCLNNANSTSSLVNPVTISTNPNGLAFTTSDNYVWILMYEIQAADQENYSTPQFIPVRKLTTNDGSVQAQVQTAAVSGAIFSIAVLTGGSGYTSAPAVTITGDGTGATATSVVSGGSVVRVTITAPGINYTTATVSFGTPGSGATAEVAIAPQGGHGKDASVELPGYFTTIAASFPYDNNGTQSVVNDFRRVGLVRNPALFGTSTTATGLQYRQTYRFRLSSVSGGGTAIFSPDELITQATTGATGRVVEHNTTLNFLYVTSVSRTFSTGASNLVTGSTSGTTAQFAAAQAGDSPALQPYTGDILFVENRKAVPRSTNQIERIKLTIEF